MQCDENGWNCHKDRRMCASFALMRSLLLYSFSCIKISVCVCLQPLSLLFCNSSYIFRYICCRIGNWCVFVVVVLFSFLVFVSNALLLIFCLCELWGFLAMHIIVNSYARVFGWYLRVLYLYHARTHTHTHTPFTHDHVLRKTEGKFFHGTYILDHRENANSILFIILIQFWCVTVHRYRK